MPEPAGPPGPSPAPVPLELDTVVVTGDFSTRDPVPIGEIASDCLAKLTGVAIAVVAPPRSPAVAALVAFKAALELGECIAKTVHRVEEENKLRRAKESCDELGGELQRTLDRELTCRFPRSVE